MNILCLNTAFNQTYVAVKSNNNLAQKTMDSSLKQSENVLGAVDQCLQDVGLNVSNLNVISCVIGPGSFTGIRIGASLCKGFCIACEQIKKVQISSLDLLAYIYAKSASPKNDFFVALNGLSGNLFVCKYNQNAQPLQPAQLMFGEEINQLNGTIVGLAEEQLDICNNYVSFNTSSLLDYTLQKINCNEYSHDFEPLYLRKSQAEAELEKKNGHC